MWPNPQFPADLVTFTKEILKWKLHFLCSVGQPEKMINFIREIISDQMESSQPAFNIPSQPGKLTGPLPYNYYQGGPAHQMMECCSHISHKSLRSNQFPKKFPKTMKWSTLEKYVRPLLPTRYCSILEECQETVSDTWKQHW